MSDIEFLLVPVSIILGLAFARLLEGLYIVSKSPQRYWVHTLWLVNKLGQILIYFWGFRTGGVVGQLLQGAGFGGLLLVMSTPTFVFLQALVLVGTRPASDRDWLERFFSDRVRFFVLNCLMIASTVAMIFWFGTPVTVVPFVLLFLLSILALLTENRIVHGVVACVAASTVALGIGVPIIQAAQGP